ncbi:MAG TPA: histidinol dehydrogenase, partial [Verrucomicrobiae bacterium]|nr:histidinol dehydrogenase [Verrucomicrobiae bacterium]
MIERSREAALVREPSAELDVRPVLDAVRAHGDAALRDYAQHFGDPPPREIPRAEIATAYDQTSAALRKALAGAAERIERFARAQRNAL